MDLLAQSIDSEGNWLLEDQFKTIPLTSPGIPEAGPDFVNYAQLLSDASNTEDTKRFLQYLHNLALYNTWFNMDVIVKGRKRPVAFIPGHIWAADRATGPIQEADIMVIGKMPGKDEIRTGRNLCGPSGEVLWSAIEATGVDMYPASWYVTNLLKFTHPAPELGNAIATAWIKDCKPLLHMELCLVKPKYILCLGSEAGKALLGMQGTVSNSSGKVFDYKFTLPDGSEHATKLMTCIHPAAVARTPDLLPQLISSLRLFGKLVTGEDIGSDEKDIEHITVRTEKEAVDTLERMIAETANGAAIAIDCEWEGEYPGDPKAWLRTIQISHKPKFAACIVLRNCGGSPNLVGSLKVKTLLNKLFQETANRKIRAVGHFYRADLPWLIDYGLDISKQFEAPADPNNGWEQTKHSGGFDTGVAAHAVCETDDYKLEVLATRLTGAPRYDMKLQQAKKDLCKQLKIKADDLTGYGNIPDDILIPYSLYDVDVTRRLFDIYNGIDDRPGLLDCDTYGNNCRVPFWITMRASPACAEMESTGLLVDMEQAEKMIVNYSLAEARKVIELREISNWPTFEPNSAFDCRELLFGTKYRGQIDKETGGFKRASPEDARLCNLTPIKATGKMSKRSWQELSKSKQADMYTPAADRETLGILFHQAPDETTAKTISLLKDVRFLRKLLGTTLKSPKQKDGFDIIDDLGNKVYEKGLLSWVGLDKRIRTHLFCTLETGRYASARPNLQNIQARREADYKLILGDQYTYPLRSIFIADPGHVLIEADYVGAELAIMAWMSGDPTMIDHVRRAQLSENDPEFYDIHSAIAVKAFKLKCAPTKSGLKSVNKLYLRIAAKNVMFGYAYGRGAEAIARQAKEEGITLSVPEAQALIDGLVAQYPMLPIYFNSCKLRTQVERHMCNCFGRFRRFSPTIDSKTEGELGRQGMNFPKLYGEVKQGEFRENYLLLATNIVYNILSSVGNSEPSGNSDISDGATTRYRVFSKDSNVSTSALTVI